jgi:hypothetical protein
MPYRPSLLEDITFYSCLALLVVAVVFVPIVLYSLQ